MVVERCINREDSSACVRLAEVGQGMVFWMESFGGDDHIRETSSWVGNPW